MTKESEIDLSFIIVNYKTEKYIRGCIDSIRKSVKNLNYEIIIVNNNEKPIDELINENSILVESSRNLGFGKANNLGSRRTKGKLLCFLNPDTKIISGNIHELIHEFNSREFGIIGPKLVTVNNKVQEWIAGKEITIWSTILNNLGYKRDKEVWESDQKKGCAWVSGAAMFVRKDVFQKIKGFDENFFMYFEDVDLCRRVRKEGYKALYFPDFTIKHFGGRSFDNKKEQKALFYQSQDYYFKKHHGKSVMKTAKLLRLLHK